MQAKELGHVVFYVRDLQASLRFWRDLLGFKPVGDAFGGKAAALSSGRTHHELLLIEVGDLPGPAPRRRGLYHVGVKVGDSKEELREAVKELQAAGVRIEGTSDHTVSWSLYVRDPDGNEVEVFCDNPAIDWKANPAAVLAPIKALQLWA
ncbi:MAG TPA: VOC family protein [Candidatus Thermoplasmatota archaeon]|nr:VOC family protein [Candidatus Thermoplasmatota archaeon]